MAVLYILQRCTTSGRHIEILFIEYVFYQSVRHIRYGGAGAIHPSIITSIQIQMHTHEIKMLVKKYGRNIKILQLERVHSCCVLMYYEMRLYGLEIEDGNQYFGQSSI